MGLLLIRGKKRFAGGKLKIFNRTEQWLPLTTESLGPYGRKSFLLPLLLSFSGASLTRIRPRGLPLAISRAWPRPFSMLPFPWAGARPRPSPLWRPGEKQCQTFWEFSPYWLFVLLILNPEHVPFKHQTHVSKVKPTWSVTLTLF